MFLPLKDDNPTLRKPYVTIGLIAVNVIVYFLTDLVQSANMATFFSFKYGLIPYEITHLEEVSAEVARELTNLRGFSSESISFSILAIASSRFFSAAISFRVPEGIASSVRPSRGLSRGLKTASRE